MNTYTGATTISSGVVSIAAASALGAAPGSPTPGHLAIGTATLATTGDVTFSGNRGIALTRHRDLLRRRWDHPHVPGHRHRHAAP